MSIIPDYITPDGEELDHDDMAERFRDYLDSDGPVDVVGLSLYPSQILEGVDPVAFRCGVNDYVDTLVCDGEIAEWEEGHEWLTDDDGDDLTA